MFNKTNRPKDLMGIFGFVFGLLAGLVFKMLKFVVFFFVNIFRRDSFLRNIRRSQHKACDLQSRFEKREVARAELFLLATKYACAPQWLKKDKIKNCLVDAVEISAEVSIESNDFNSAEASRFKADLLRRVNKSVEEVSTLPVKRTHPVNRTSVYVPPVRSDESTQFSKTKLDDWGKQPENTRN